MRRSLLSLALPLMLGACSISTLEESEHKPAQNTCESDEQCGENGVCDLAQGICRASSGELGTLLVQITAPSQSGSYSLMSFVQVEKGLRMDGGPIELAVPEPGEIEALVIPPSDALDCVAEYGAIKSSTVPVSVRFRPTERLLGLSTPDIESDTPKLDEVGANYMFKARMPPGRYDVYVAPDPNAISVGACSVVPQVFRNFEVTAGKVEVGDEPIALHLQSPSKLTVTVEWPTDQSGNQANALAGWKIDVIDPATGWLLSRSAELALDADVSEPGMERFVATVEYSRLPDAELEGTELVRLSPPAPIDSSQPKALAPTFALQRKAIEVLTPGAATINQITGLPDPVQVEGSLFDSNENDVSAEVTLRFVSNKLILDGNAYQNPAHGSPVYFSTEAKAVSGRWGVALLPGEYDVYAIPAAGDSNLALTRASLTVSAEQTGIQGGKSIIVNHTTELQGLARGPDGKPVTGAKLRAIASPELADPLLIALGLTPPKPLSADGIVGSNGSFAVDVHPGTLDVSIRPDQSTKFAWFVRPNVAVQGDGGIHALGEVKLPLPVVYEGLVKVADGVPLPNALIQAYVFLDAQGYSADREGASAVVQVAETRADGAGGFLLLLPAHLN
jgi:hypothetical protein